MSEDATHDRLAPARLNIQANLVRAAKYSEHGARDWSLFFFFRIMTQAEVGATLTCSRNAMKDPKNTSKLESLLLDLEQPSLVNTRRRPRYGWSAEPAIAEAAPAPPVSQPPQAASRSASKSGPPAEPDLRPDPASQFLDWLDVLVNADKSAIVAQANAVAGEPAAAGDQANPLDAKAFFEILQALRSPETAAKLEKRDDLLVNDAQRLLQLYAGVLSDPARYRDLLRMFGSTPGEAGAKALEDSLMGVTIYELLRQGAPAFARDAAAGEVVHGVIRGEAHSRGGTQAIYDPVPINLAFTSSGLNALKLDPITLASFPEPFTQGMAARALRLNDTGPNAPANWDSEFGLSSLHGFFTGGFAVGANGHPIKEAVWRKLRKDVDAFNNRKSTEGRFLRTILGLLFRQFGLEIVRIELAQDPYDLDKTGEYAVSRKERVEHFGFRDGLSQPFADLGLCDPAAGGGTPDVDGTWSPVAPGEIYLDLPDEDGEVQQLPANKDLRKGGTYLVFRKLEQDVSGFRAFLAQQRPDNSDAQAKLAAQFVGRWANGTPLALSPDEARDVGTNNEEALNNFRYAADDPSGLKCPLGAHIRRTNPRDTGGRDEVKRHRILRRGMAYGGPLLPEGSLGDGQPRGLFFIAVNSRIDLQFEVIQADWINNGEFLGQAGLNHCPLVGGRDGTIEDSFLESGAVAPVTGLPAFVFTRGGDYFFAPGVSALRLLVSYRNDDTIKKFPADCDPAPFDGDAMGDAVTLGLFDPNRVSKYAAAILASQPPAVGGAVRLQLPPAAVGSPQTMVFVGHHEDVVRVLSGPAPGQPLDFSVEQYRLASERITRGYDFIAGTEPVGATADMRKRMYGMLCKAWSMLKPPQGVPTTDAWIAQITQQRLEAAIRRTASVGRVDLVHDLAVQAAYGVVTDLYGAPGPSWLTELAPALPFGSQHIASLPPDWLAAVKGGQPADPGLTSMQIWSVLMLADVLGNLQSDHDAWPFSRQAGSEMLSHIDGLLAAAFARAKIQQAKRTKEQEQEREKEKEQEQKRPTTLVEAFAELALNEANQQGYLRLAAVILVELISDTIAAVPATFGHILSFLLDNRIDLASLRDVLALPNQGELSAVERVIYEAERLNPILPVLLRRCERRTKLPGGAEIRRGEMVAALVQAADLDPTVFTCPFTFSLNPYIPGPTRNLGDYLAFGASSGNHACWGRTPVAMPVLIQCVKAAARLEGLRQIAGAGGQPQLLVGVTIGLPARFTRAISPITRTAPPARGGGVSQPPPASQPAPAGQPAPASQPAQAR